MWLELVSADTSTLYQPPLCSTLQTIRNLASTLYEVERGILLEYHVRDSAEETLDRLKDCGWMKEIYSDDLVVLKELLQRLRDAHAESKVTADEEKSRKQHQEAMRTTVA